MEIKLKKITSSDNIPLGIKDLYLSSFPDEERRDWRDIALRIDRNDPIFSFYVLQHNDENVGFITLWRLPRALYCEHFAILPSFRSGGLGAVTVKQAIELAENLIPGRPLPFILEVELPESSVDAKRRIEFYKRCGMTALDTFPYWQPPYRADLPDVPMMLMASKDLDDPTATAMMLHTIVYNQ